ncbi:DUF1450 domain-containing protein [Priestia megaterium]|nr:DUF1450 domain-containing protein [Priestia megaterium]
MKHTIKFCMTNYINGSDLIKDMAEQNSDLQIIEETCLGNCGQCYMKSFAVIGEKPVAVNDYEELLENISYTHTKKETPKQSVSH